jgi:hypothetical protein
MLKQLRNAQLAVKLSLLLTAQCLLLITESSQFMAYLPVLSATTTKTNLAKSAGFVTAAALKGKHFNASSVTRHTYSKTVAKIAEFQTPTRTQTQPITLEVTTNEMHKYKLQQ